MDDSVEIFDDLTIKLYDTGSDHVYINHGFWSFTGTKKPSNIKWTKDYSNSSRVSVFVDEFILNSSSKLDDSDIKIAWLFESKGIIPKIYDRINVKSKLIEKFDMFAAHDMSLVRKFKNGVYVPVGGSWLTSKDFDNPFIKDQLISMIASNKRVTEGHNLRHRVIDKFSKDNVIDFWGKSVGRAFESKADPLKNYMFSICIMNSNYDCYFTEILNDCLLMKTIPVFWGTKSVKNVFNQNGFIFWETLEDLERILIQISADEYLERMEAVEENFLIARSLSDSDLNLRRAIFKKFGI